MLRRKLKTLYIGQKIERLTILAEAERSKFGHRMWNCRCECGVVKTISDAMLKRGEAKSCGCYFKEFHLKHGEASARRGKKKATYEYETWTGIKYRCFNPNAPQYYLYGARQIKVCDRWRNSYSAFLEDMGRKPGKGYSIERINNDGDYEPANCKWATMKEQAQNKRKPNPASYPRKRKSQPCQS